MPNLVHDERSIVDSEFHQTLFCLLDCLEELVLLHQSATLDIRHQAFRTKDPRQLLQRGHVLGCGNDLIEVDDALAHIFQHVLVAENVGTLRFQLFMELFACEDADSDFFSCSGGENASATNILVTLGRVNVQLDDHFEALFEFAFFGNFSCNAEDLSCVVLLLSVDLDLGTVLVCPVLRTLLLVETLQSCANQNRPS